MIEHSGFFRRVEPNYPGAVWEEGPGWIVFDERARIDGRPNAGLISGLHNDLLVLYVMRKDEARKAEIAAAEEV